MTSNRVAFVAEYEDGRTVEFSIDRWTLSLGDYAARIIARERQEKGDCLQARSGQLRAGLDRPAGFSIRASFF
jgi:hypothetical protein